MDVEIQETDSVGYVLKIRVGDKVMSGEEFRNKYELASSCFTLQPYNGKLRVTDKRSRSRNRYESVHGK